MDERELLDLFAAKPFAGLYQDELDSGYYCAYCTGCSNMKGRWTPHDDDCPIAQARVFLGLGRYGRE